LNLPQECLLADPPSVGYDTPRLIIHNCPVNMQSVPFFSTIRSLAIHLHVSYVALQQQTEFTGLRSDIFELTPCQPDGPSG
jgi:hypothetical protein